MWPTASMEDILSAVPRQDGWREGDTSAPRFGLPASLRVPIAARSLDVLEKFVGDIIAMRRGRKGAVQAIALRQPAPDLESDVPLWKGPGATEALDRLFPITQVWVDVDFAGYRRAYIDFGLTIPALYFLDHVQNRRAIRLRDRSHPWLRLSPVHRRVNTSGGLPSGGEGMEVEYVRRIGRLEPIEHHIIYADPMDLTKMLNVEPGLGVLNGVRDTQELFFPSG
jgi:hypothetical protein